MAWCPECRMYYSKEYSSILRCVDCDVELVDKLSEDTLKIKRYVSSWGNPELWAESTLPESVKTEDLIKVHEIGGEKCRERIWLHDILDDNEIPYRIEIFGEFPMKKTGKRRRKYKECQHIYVEKIHKSTISNFIKEYKNPKNIVQEDFDEENTGGSTKTLPQVKCPACGKEIDFDYLKCPFCKTQL